jgi:hypothetical protein
MSRNQYWIRRVVQLQLTATTSVFDTFAAIGMAPKPKQSTESLKQKSLISFFGGKDKKDAPKTRPAKSQDASSSSQPSSTPARKHAKHSSVSSMISAHDTPPTSDVFDVDMLDGEQPVVCSLNTCVPNYVINVYFPRGQRNENYLVLRRMTRALIAMFEAVLGLSLRRLPWSRAREQRRGSCRLQ